MLSFNKLVDIQINYIIETFNLKISISAKKKDLMIALLMSQIL
jgi:hypothetical protein